MTKIDKSFMIESGREVLSNKHTAVSLPIVLRDEAEAEFAWKFGWKNDPTKARLIKLE